MDKLSQQELVRIRRGAEDAIQAINGNHKSFIEAVSHPLNIIALVDMAQASIGQQAKVEELQKRVDILEGATEKTLAWFDQKYVGETGLESMLWVGKAKEARDELEQALKGESND